MLGVSYLMCFVNTEVQIHKQAINVITTLVCGYPFFPAADKCTDLEGFVKWNYVYLQFALNPWKNNDKLFVI